MRNPYFHEWSHAARPDGYPDRIVFRRTVSQEAEITDVENGSADYEYDGVPPDRIAEVQTRFASQLYINPAIGTDALILNTRVAPFDDVRVRQAINYAVDRAQDRTARSARGPSRPARCCRPASPATGATARTRSTPTQPAFWHAPDLAKAERLIAASRTRGTPDHDLEPRAVPDRLHPGVRVPDLTSRPARIPDPGRSITRTASPPAGSSTTRAPGRKPRSTSSSRPTRPPPRSSKSTSPASTSCPNSAGQPQRFGVLRRQLDAEIERSARRREQQRSRRGRAVGASRPHRHRRRARRPADDTERDRLRLSARRRLPVQLSTRRPARPTLGALSTAAGLDSCRPTLLAICKRFATPCAHIPAYGARRNERCRLPR